MKTSNNKKTQVFKGAAALITAALLALLFTACPNAAGGGGTSSGGNTGGGSSGGGSGSVYVQVAYSELDTYLANTALSTKVNYIEVTGTIPADNFGGSGGSPSVLGQKIKAASPKKVALKLPGEVADLDSMKFCFYGCTNLVSLAGIPASVKDMTDCFNGCTSLTKAPVIPTSVIIMESCFRGCTSLTQVPDIPESVTDMKYCFSGCTALKGVQLLCNYDGTGDRFKGVFKNCTALEAGGVKVPGAFYNNYTAPAALDDMAVPPAGNTAEQKKKFSAF